MLVWRRVEVLESGGRVPFDFTEPLASFGDVVDSGTEYAVFVGSLVGVVIDDTGVELEAAGGRREPQTAPRPCSSPKAANFSNPFSRPKIRPSIRPALAPSETPWS